jgi:hypothetical protein
MKVSAIIMYSPNKEARKEVKFAGDSHRLVFTNVACSQIVWI